jgi:hypothetical protein
MLIIHVTNLIVAYFSVSNQIIVCKYPLEKSNDEKNHKKAKGF